MRDHPLDISTRRSETSPLRLVGYFVGGVMLANLVLMMSSAFRGDAATPSNPTIAAKRGPAAAVGAVSEKSLHAMTAPETESEPAVQAPAPSAPAAEPKLAITAVCPDARDRLIGAMAHYYLQRSQHPRASAEDVTEAAGAMVLLAGPAEPSTASGKGCTG